MCSCNWLSELNHIVHAAQKNGWKSLVEEYHADAALRYKRDLDRGQPDRIQRIIGEPASKQDADAFCRLAASMQSGAAAGSITPPAPV